MRAQLVLENGDQFGDLLRDGEAAPSVRPALRFRFGSDLLGLMQNVGCQIFSGAQEQPVDLLGETGRCGAERG